MGSFNKKLERVISMLEKEDITNMCKRVDNWVVTFDKDVNSILHETDCGCFNCSEDINAKMIKENEELERVSESLHKQLDTTYDDYCKEKDAKDSKSAPVTKPLTDEEIDKAFKFVKQFQRLGRSIQDSKADPRCNCGHKRSEHVRLVMGRCNHRFTGYGGGKRCNCEGFQNAQNDKEDQQ